MESKKNRASVTSILFGRARCSARGRVELKAEVRARIWLLLRFGSQKQYEYCICLKLRLWDRRIQSGQVSGVDNAKRNAEFIACFFTAYKSLVNLKTFKWVLTCDSTTGNTGLFEKIVWVLTTATSFSRCNPMWFLSMGLRQGSGLCFSSSRKYTGIDCRVDVCRITNGAYIE